MTCCFFFCSVFLLDPSPFFFFGGILKGTLFRRPRCRGSTAIWLSGVTGKKKTETRGRKDSNDEDCQL